MALATNLVSYWKLDGNSNDAVGTNNGTDSNITYSAGNGKINQGAGFTVASSSNISLGTGLNSYTSAFSISLWIKTTTTDTHFVGHYTASNTGWTLAMNDASGHYSFFAGGTWCTTSAQALNLDGSTWNHIVVTWDGTTVKIYTNGNSAESFTPSSPNMTSALNVYLGRAAHAAAAYMNGAIDEFAFWSRAISASEATALYNSGNGTQYPFSTAYTVTATQQSYTLTGQNATLSHTIPNLVATTQTYTLTGETVNFALGIGYELVCTKQDYALTGNNANLSTQKRLTATYQTYVLAGQDVTWAGSRTMTTVMRTYALTGSSIRVLWPHWTTRSRNSSSWTNRARN